MITGDVLRTKTLRSARGTPSVISVIRAAPTDANRAALLETHRQWMADWKRLPTGSVAAKRAYFAADVAILTGNALCAKIAGNHILVAVDQGGAVRGISAYLYFAGAGKWELSLHTVAPRDQGGNPNPDQTRGIGSELLGAVAADMAAEACTTVELEPLDSAAERYWRSRGFHNGTKPLHLSCPELRRLAEIYAHTPADDADQLCHDRDWRRQVSLRVQPRVAVR